MALPATTREYIIPKVGSYNNLKLQERPTPQPRASEVLVRVHAVSLQYRDLLVANGLYPVGRTENIVPCSDMAGEIVALGSDVKGWKQGDRVCANFAFEHLYGDTNEEILRSAHGGQADGVLTEFKTFPAYSLVGIPNHLSYEEGSTLPCAGLTAYNALNGSKPIKSGDFVLVLGTGGVSFFALQFAVAAGAIVIATSSSDEKLKLAAKHGAKHTINYKTTPSWDDEVLNITKGVGVDHIIEVGGKGTLPRSINAARYGGIVHLIGSVSKDDTDFDLVKLVIGKSVVLRGIMVGSVAQFKNMIRAMEANPAITRPVIHKHFKFEDAIKAYAYLESQAHTGKIVIRVLRH